MRCWTAIPPPSTLTRSILASVMVSAWSKIQCRPLNGISRLTFSNTFSIRLIDSCEQIRQYRAIVVHDSSRHAEGTDLRVLDEQPILSMHSFSDKLQAQVDGLGCGYLPRYLAAPHLASGALVERQLDSETRRDQVFLAWSDSATGNVAMWWRERLQNFEGIRSVYAVE